MRLPLSKVYRAFPELDKFGDADCERYVHEARRQHRISEGFAGLGAVVISIIAILAIIACGSTVLKAASAHRWDRGPLWELFQVVLLIAGISAGTMAGFMIRDVWLRWAIRTRLNNAVCSRCRYSLLGLPVRAGAVVCPECGLDIPLEFMGLTAADILSAECRDHPMSASPSDSP